MSAPVTDLPTDPGAPELAEAIVATVIETFAARAAGECAADWYSYDSYARFTALLRTGTAHSPAPRTVIAEAPGTAATVEDVEIWGYVAFEALDAACAPFRLPDTAHISDVEVPGRYRLTW
ncbi:hypothetical protein ACL02S_24005 [Nocardia sp. 004]|uniref:hypothetical protein n=1 Tax=Nocardia sp. 004 TaxID=3385978 RepID=UPI0039A3D781